MIFRRHVVGRAGDELAVGERLRGLGTREAEVDDGDVVGSVDGIDDDVVALDVGVDDAGIVDRGQAFEDLVDDVTGAAETDRALLDQIRERGAASAVHDEERRAIGRGALVDQVDDIGMANPAHDAAFVAERFRQQEVTRERVAEPFDHHVAA